MRISFTTLFFALGCLLLSASGYSAPGDQELIRQQENQRAREAALAPETPDVRLSAPSSSSGRLQFPKETPCFPINTVELQNRRSLPHWLPLQKIANQANGQCLGSGGINLLMSALQNRLIDSGYVTSRVVAPQQDLTRGSLMLALVPGNIRHVALTPQSGHYVTRFTAFPAHGGNLLDLRDIEQGLENLQRVPTVQASMEIVPGEKPGESDIALSWQQSKMWRVGASLDDSGSRSTGRYQGGVTVYGDNLLSLSDTLYLSAGSSLHAPEGKGTHNYTGQYSLPFGYWATSLTASNNSYYQTVAGLNGDIRYSGESNNIDWQLSRVLHRNASQKTSFTYDVIARDSKNFVNGTEVDVQRRQTAAWKIGLQHRHYIDAATLDAGISYQRGTRWFGAIPASEEYYGEATALSKIIQLNAQLDAPFVLAAQNFRYNVQYLRQMSNTPLTPQDQFSIGGRWTVRGFDGERTLSADRGWTVRNELAWQTPVPNHQLYLGVDYGEIGGHGSEYNLGNHLAGGAVGLRGGLWGASYDTFVGIPLSKPDGFTTDPVTLGFNLNWQY
ncbi:ShlB/FhaC/HecB family hemolysin secretion/activation protein [Buttiauxella selenatireducens]|uniref:ShlB/FhaC/HecB family hemolysin secretion/activation protein n=1 Tax=Buttiauxella selenatireducens TaxID=3073902 RepID=A0ABY9SAF8_9ENTR|nr:ShlB/FhaC/HecB family hemolysin secretion/activation protein [Buttiauxella sp. R73]WMY74492.1 ShlB/FhaC/HecB family hemolysin secretion/activation protein [Buttiauxella sp. R73]